MVTGSIVTPFLPGDSLLLIAGAFAGIGVLDLLVPVPLMLIAAIIGDQVNYWVGRWAGMRISAWNSRVVKPEYIRSASQSFDRYGSKSVFLARFAPVLRYLVPFLAGVGSMECRWFVLYNILGGACWVLLFVGGGYFFGTTPIVRDNLSLIGILIIAASFGVLGIGLLGDNREWLRGRLRRRTE
ncbi:MAG: VTT domain-containing protein [Methanospirillum sp.]